MAMSPYSVHPVFIAMAAATLDEMYPGRVILAGAAVRRLSQAGGPGGDQAVVSIDETMKTAAPAGREMADFQGQCSRSRRRLANGGRKVPIVLAASRARMLSSPPRERRCVISAATSPPFVKACLAEAASTDPGFRKVGIVYTKPRDGEGRHRPDPTPIGFVRAVPIMPRTSVCPAPSSTRRRRHRLCRGELAEVDRLGATRRAPSRRLRHARSVRAKLEEYRAIVSTRSWSVAWMMLRRSPRRLLPFGDRGRDRMKFLITCRPLRRGDVSHPFVGPAISCAWRSSARSRLRFGMGNDHITSQHYVRELFPTSAEFLRASDGASFCAAATTRIRVGTALAVLPMRDPSGGTSRPRPSTSSPMAGWCWHWASALSEEFAPGARRAPRARRGERWMRDWR